MSHGGRQRPPTSAPPTYRPARPGDLAGCARVWWAGLNDYLARLNAAEGLSTDLTTVERLYAHLLETDPGGFWVATRLAGGHADDAPGAAGQGADAGNLEAGQVVGFGAAAVRSRVWFLSMLFVDPGEQAAGVGTELLRRTMAAAPVTAVRATVTDAAQPISNALYAREGVVPRVPLYRMVGRPDRPGTIGSLPGGVSATSFDGVVREAGSFEAGHRRLSEIVGEIDEAILGYAHPADHAYLRREARLGLLYRDALGHPVGYGYTSVVGRVGPIAVRDEALLAPIVDHVLEAVRPAGASALWVPGSAGPLFAALLRAGFRLDGFPTLLCWSAPFADFTRYVPASPGLL